MKNDLAKLLKGISSTMAEGRVNAPKGMLYSLYETRYRIRITAVHALSPPSTIIMLTS